jgi:hypothetical protein
MSATARRRSGSTSASTCLPTRSHAARGDQQPPPALCRCWEGPLHLPRQAAHAQDKELTLPAPEFLRRFLLHVVPRGFMRT